jgi:hypothetical protein
MVKDQFFPHAGAAVFAGPPAPPGGALTFYIIVFNGYFSGPSLALNHIEPRGARSWTTHCMSVCRAR